MRLPQRQELLAAQFGRQAGIAGEDHAQQGTRVEVHRGEQAQLVEDGRMHFLRLVDQHHRS